MDLLKILCISSLDFQSLYNICGINSSRLHIAFKSIFYILQNLWELHKHFTNACFERERVLIWELRRRFLFCVCAFHTRFSGVGVILISIGKTLKIQNSTLLIFRNLQQDCAECVNLSRIQIVKWFWEIVENCSYLV